MLKKLALVVGLLFASNAHSEWQVLSSDNSLIFDTNAQLAWQRCAVGQSYSESGCVGEAALLTFAQATKLPEVVSGEFRLPSISELYSLVDCHGAPRRRVEYINQPQMFGFVAGGEVVHKKSGKQAPLNGKCLPNPQTTPASFRAINQQYFPDPLVKYNSFWSRDALPYNAPYIFIVYFSTGEQAYRHRSETAYVRLIKTHKD